MINVIPTDIDFIYTLKKALSLNIFSNPLAISDFIDILDSTLRKSFGIDAIRSFEFLDGDYQFTIVIGKDYCDDRTSDKLHNVVIDSVMEFCKDYKDNIDSSLSKVGDKKDISTFDDCMISGQGNLLSEIFQKLEFNTMDGYCIVVRMY